MSSVLTQNLSILFSNIVLDTFLLFGVYFANVYVYVVRGGPGHISGPFNGIIPRCSHQSSGMGIFRGFNSANI
mgnify:CR=1 FL=1